MHLRIYTLMNKIICSFSFLLSAFTCREPNYCKIVDCITKSYLKEIAAPRGLILSGYGGAMMDEIQSVTLRFFSSKALNVDEARVLYIEMMEEFLSRINCHEKIRPHLHTFPFGVDNIKLTISFVDSQGHTTKDGYIALMYIGRNQDLLYRACNPDTEEFYSLHREPYAEACRIVEGH
jgi:hypothetical protein